MIRQIILFVMLFISCSVAERLPMEPIIKYNVVLVHGAADSYSGLDCDGDVAYNSAYDQSQNWIQQKKGTGWKIGGAPGMMGSYGDDAGLPYWLNRSVFGYDADTLQSPYLYLQRAFVNPAETPLHNAHEIGDRIWKGAHRCSARRSLFEEAQEVRAGGQDVLDSLRRSPFASYRTVPSRNIIIAHSMGGVSSREYVQGDGYNHDVDKVITLDSPHEGTGAPRRKLKC